MDGQAIMDPYRLELGSLLAAIRIKSGGRRFEVMQPLC